MKVPQIKTEILNKYRTLNNMAHISPKNNISKPLWMLRMGSWQVDETSDIWCNRNAKVASLLFGTVSKLEDWSAITMEQADKITKCTTRITADIDTNCDKVVIKHKPFWMSKKHALKNVNNALDDFVNNYNVDEIVHKGVIPIAAYTEEYINWLRGENPSFKYKEY